MIVLVGLLVLVFSGAATLLCARTLRIVNETREEVRVVAGHVNAMDVADTELKRSVDQALGQMTVTLTHHVAQQGGLEPVQPVVLGRKALEVKRRFKELEEESRLRYEAGRQ